MDDDDISEFDSEEDDDDLDYGDNEMDENEEDFDQDDDQDEAQYGSSKVSLDKETAVSDSAVAKDDSSVNCQLSQNRTDQDKPLPGKLIFFSSYLFSSFNLI